MFQVRIHGRTGQATGTAAELLTAAALAEGWHALTYALVGGRPPGSPSVAHCRFDRLPIAISEPIPEPDAVIIQDSTLLYQVDVLNGLRPDGFVLMNSEYTWTELGLVEVVRQHGPGRALTVPATRLARAHLGRPLLIAPLLGGFAAQTGLVGMAGVEQAIRGRFVARMTETAIEAAWAAHARTRAEVAMALAEPAKPPAAARTRAAATTVLAEPPAAARTRAEVATALGEPAVAARTRAEVATALAESDAATVLAEPTAAVRTAAVAQPVTSV